MALKKLVHKEWSTHKARRTGKDGVFSFHGFFGEYHIVAESEGKREEASIHLAKDNANTFTLSLQGQ